MRKLLGSRQFRIRPLVIGLIFICGVIGSILPITSQKSTSAELIPRFGISAANAQVYSSIYGQGAGAGQSVAAAKAADRAQQASTWDGLIIGLFKAIFYPIFWLEGILLSIFTRILFWVIDYNTFTTAPPVQLGWIIVRDISNMGFVIILLIISIATIVRYESYGVKQLLPKLVIMAVLVNFSLTISGLFIDFSQIIMLTFVAAFSSIATAPSVSAQAGGTGVLSYITPEAGLVRALRIDQIIGRGENFTGPLDNASGGFIGILSVAGSLLLAIFMLAIVIIVLIVFLVIILFRIVMLWFLCVMSPLPYLLSAFPEGAKYAQRWWGEFGKYLTVGPVLAFFLWLTFSVASSSPEFFTGTRPDKPLNDLVSGESQQTLINGVAKPDIMISYIIVIVMLIAGLQITSELGVEGGNLASWAAGKARSTAGLPVRLAGGGLKLGAFWAGRRLDDAQAGLQKKAIDHFGLADGKTWYGRLGKRIGLDKLAQVGGGKFRTLPGALQHWREYIEEEAVGDSQAGIQDVLHRLPIPGREETQFADLQRAARVSEAKHHFHGVEEQSILIGHLHHTMDHHTGKVKEGKEYEAQALLEMLMANHDANEVLKNMDIAHMTGFQWKNERGEDDDGAKGEYHAFNVQQLLRGMFGEKEGARVGVALSDIGFKNNDQVLKAIATKDPHGDYEFISAEAMPGVANAFVKKLELQALARQNTSQNLFTEKADANGRVVHGPVHTLGAGSVARQAAAAVSNNNRTKAETDERWGKNADEFVRFWEQNKKTGEFSYSPADEAIIAQGFARTLGKIFTDQDLVDAGDVGVKQKDKEGKVTDKNVETFADFAKEVKSMDAIARFVRSSKAQEVYRVQQQERAAVNYNNRFGTAFGGGVVALADGSSVDLASAENGWLQDAAYQAAGEKIRELQSGDAKRALTPEQLRDVQGSIARAITVKKDERARRQQRGGEEEQQPEPEPVHPAVAGIQAGVAAAAAEREGRSTESPTAVAEELEQLARGPIGSEGRFDISGVEAALREIENKLDTLTRAVGEGNKDISPLLTNLRETTEGLHRPTAGGQSGAPLDDATYERNWRKLLTALEKINAALKKDTDTSKEADKPSRQEPSVNPGPGVDPGEGENSDTD